MASRSPLVTIANRRWKEDTMSKKLRVSVVEPVADPAGSMGRPRTTHKFGPKFYYYFPEIGPRSLSSQSRPKTP